MSRISPSRPSKPAAESSRPVGRGRPDSQYPLRPMWRLAVSVLLVVHLVVVVTVPLAMVPPRSRLAARLLDVVGPYVDAFQVSHGYAFFAAEPGPSHLIEYELTMPDGSVESGLRLPDAKKQWPRLFYHRHFMLSEKLDAFKIPPTLRPEPREPPADLMKSKWVAAGWREAHDRWQERIEDLRRDREVYLAIGGSYAEHLRQVTGAKSVRLYLVEHRIPSPEMVLAGARLDDPASYVIVPATLVTAPAAAPDGAGSSEEVASPGQRSQRMRIEGEGP